MSVGESAPGLLVGAGAGNDRFLFFIQHALITKTTCDPGSRIHNTENIVWPKVVSQAPLPTSKQQIITAMAKKSVLVTAT